MGQLPRPRPRTQVYDKMLHILLRIFCRCHSINSLGHVITPTHRHTHTLTCDGAHMPRHAACLILINCYAATRLMQQDRDVPLCPALTPRGALHFHLRRELSFFSCSSSFFFSSPSSSSSSSSLSTTIDAGIKDSSLCLSAI